MHKRPEEPTKFAWFSGCSTSHESRGMQTPSYSHRYAENWNPPVCRSVYAWDYSISIFQHHLASVYECLCGSVCAFWAACRLIIFFSNAANIAKSFVLHKLRALRPIIIYVVEFRCTVAHRDESEWKTISRWWICSACQIAYVDVKWCFMPNWLRQKKKQSHTHFGVCVWLIVAVQFLSWYLFGCVDLAVPNK